MGNRSPRGSQFNIKKFNNIGTRWATDPLEEVNLIFSEENCRTPRNLESTNEGCREILKTGKNSGRGVLYLTREYLKVVWAEFSTIS